MNAASRRNEFIRLGLANRLALIFSLLVFVATATVGFLVYRGARQSLIETSTDRLVDTAAIISRRFTRHVEAFREDAGVLADSPPVMGLVNIYNNRQSGYQLDREMALSESEWMQLMEQVSTSFLENRPSYLAIRLVGAWNNGRELGRAERRNGAIVWVPRNELQHLGEDPFFAQTTSLPRGQLLLSEITLHTADSLDVPRLRVGMPIYTKAGDIFGAIVLDVEVNDMFNKLSELLTTRKSLYIANERGKILRLYTDNMSRTEADASDMIQELFPEVIPLMNEEEEALRIRRAQADDGQPVLAYFERVHFDGGAEDNALIVGVTSPYAVILDGVRRVRNQSLLITILFGLSGMLFALAFSRYLTQPLRRITHAISGFSRGEWAEELPTDRTDEIGLLAQTFTHMADEIQEQVITLESEEHRQRTILETSPEGIIVTDATGHIEVFNAAAEHILGYNDEDVIGQKASLVLRAHPVNGTEHVAAREQDQEAWMTLEPGAEATGVRQDGTVVPLAVTWSTFSLAGETRYTIFLQDITERKAAEAVRSQLLQELKRERESLQRLSDSLEERVKERTDDLARSNKTLEQRNRELQDFAYVASHDLQEPLRKIRAFSDLLQAEYGDELARDAGFYIERMQDAAERMAHLISDLLAFSRVTTKARPFEKVDLNDVAREVLSDLEFQRKDVQGDVIVDPLPTIEAERTQIGQLLQNLISNAFKFHREGVPPVVHVRAEVETTGHLTGLDGPVCRLEVEDNGIGFDEKYLDRIFSPFQRLHGRSEYEGTGMGLTICRRIVERHEGTITAHSTPGQGTTFIVHLPVHQKPSRTSESLAEAEEMLENGN